MNTEEREEYIKKAEQELLLWTVAFDNLILKVQTIRHSLMSKYEPLLKVLKVQLDIIKHDVEQLKTANGQIESANMNVLEESLYALQHAREHQLKILRAFIEKEL